MLSRKLKKTRFFLKILRLFRYIFVDFWLFIFMLSFFSMKPFFPVSIWVLKVCLPLLRTRPISLSSEVKLIYYKGVNPFTEVRLWILHYFDPSWPHNDVISLKLCWWPFWTTDGPKIDITQKMFVDGGNLNEIDITQSICNFYLDVNICRGSWAIVCKSRGRLDFEFR